MSITRLTGEGLSETTAKHYQTRVLTNANAENTWLTAGGDNSRRGAFDGQVNPKAKPVRRFRAGGALQASVLVDQTGCVFTADLAGGLTCFSPEGKVKWSAKLIGGISATPTCGRFGSPERPSEPRLFAATHNGLVYALDPETGETVWRVELPTNSDPRILSDLLLLARAELVVLSSWGGKYCALDASSGELRFSWNAGISPRAAASADSRENIYCLRATTEAGIELVRVNTRGEETSLFRGGAAHEEEGQPAGDWVRRAMVAAAPVIDESRSRVLFVVNGESESALHAWSFAEQKQSWRVVLPATVQATPAVSQDGTVIVADLGGSVLAVRQGAGQRYNYATACEYLLAGPVCGADGEAIVGDPLGIVHRISATGKAVKLFEAARAIQARPSIGPNGNLYIPAMDRVVYVLSG